MLGPNNVTMTLYHNDQPVTSIVRQIANKIIDYSVSRERAALLANVHRGDTIYVRLLSGQVKVDKRHTTSFAGFLVYPAV